MALSFENKNTDAESFLNGRILRLSSIHDPPWMIFPQLASSMPSEASGICFEIVNTLREKYNFSFTVESPVDGGYGAKQSNGSWSGMIGMILKNVSDMAIGPFAVTIHRQEVIDFTTSFYQEPFSILIPSPTEDDRLWAAFRPFQLTVWVLLIFAMAFMPLMTWLSLKWLLIGGSLRESSPLMKQLKAAYGILLAQSGQRISNGSTTLRILWAIWCLSSVILIYAYVGSITSFLSVPKLHPLIQSIQDLPDSSSSSFRLIIQRGSSLESIFMEATDGIYGYIGDRLRKNLEWIMEKEAVAVEAVAQRNSFFLNAQSTLDFLIEQDYKSTSKCRLSIAKRDYFKVNSAFVVAKDSPLKDIFNQKILQMIESGLMSYWRRKYWPFTEECNDNSLLRYNNGNRAHSLSMVDLQSAFLIFGLGTGLAFIAQLFEHLSHRYMIHFLNIFI